jgi:hypothetical protein
MSHTPGPWIYDIHDGTFYIFTKADLEMVADGDPDKPGIGRMRGVGRGASSEEQEANARLIAAAPDMLAACKNLIDAAVTDSDACPICIHELTDHVSGCPIEVVAEAIAKAEGQS